MATIIGLFRGFVMQMLRVQCPFKALHLQTEGKKLFKSYLLLLRQGGAITFQLVTINPFFKSQFVGKTFCQKCERKGPFLMSLSF